MSDGSSTSERRAMMQVTNFYVKNLKIALATDDVRFCTVKLSVQYQISEVFWLYFHITDFIWVSVILMGRCRSNYVVVWTALYLVA